MAVGLKAPQRLLPVPGVRLAAGCAGLYKTPRPDLCLIESAPGSTAAAVFTRNAFCAAPVHVARSHLSLRNPRFCLINAGNANAGCGEQGVSAAIETCRWVAGIAGCSPEEVLPFSTGVIGQPLPVSAIGAALPLLYSGLGADHWLEACSAIMTTDTVPKGTSRKAVLGDTEVTVTGIAKGSGMIHPNLATMLAFVATDAPVSTGVLTQVLNHAVGHSFNRISVDGDTSTNDAVVLLATGQAHGHRVDDIQGANARIFQAVVNEICTQLAMGIVRDGEGATKFITIRVDEGATAGECLNIANAVATSTLIKTAFFASDPNWGRILAAVGRAGPDDLDTSRVMIALNDVRVVERGARAGGYTEQAGRRIMCEAEIVIRISLGRGSAAETVWTCDLSHDYVTINAEYRT